MNIENNNSGGGGIWIAIALLLILFYGDPDLADALMFALSGGDSHALAEFVDELHPPKIVKEDPAP